MNLPEKGLWALVLDTSAVFAWVNRLDPDHGWVKGQVARFPGPLVLPAAILAEVGYLLEKRLGLKPLLRFLEDLEAGFFLVHWDAEALSHAHRMLLRYRDLPLGLTDALVAATGLLWQVPVLTLDAHFLVLAQGEGLEVVHPHTSPL